MELKKRQQVELDEFRISIENGTVQTGRIHYSQSILEMTKKAEYLGQTGFYKDAKILKKQIKQIKRMEEEKYNAESRKKLFAASNAMI